MKSGKTQKKINLDVTRYEKNNLYSHWYMLGVFGCIHDETTGPHLDISDLSTTFEDSVIYITSTENLRLDAGSFIVQTDSNCPLEYTWSAGKITGWNTSTKFWQLDSMSELSHEQVLDYNFKELGRHLLRLKVVNSIQHIFNILC